MYELRNDRHHNVYLQRCFNKYGEDTFVFSIVEETNNLFEREEYYIETMNPEFNIGGVGGGDLISKHPEREKIIEKIKASVQDKISSMTNDERKEKYGMPGETNPNWRGGTSIKTCSCGNTMAYTATTCINCRDRTGEANPFYGKHHTEETREKLRQANKGSIPPNRRKVKAGNKEYDAVALAAKDLNVSSATIIYRIKSKSSKWKDFFYTS